MNCFYRRLGLPDATTSSSALVIMLTAMTIGCERSDDVRVYQVPKTPETSQTDQPIAKPREETSGNSNGGQLDAARSAQPAATPATPSIHYIVPENWTEQPGDGMRTAAFTFEGDLGSGQVTLIVLPGQAGGPAANINRWRGQVGLEPLPEQTAFESATQITVDGQPGLLVDLTGAEISDQPAQRIVAAIVMHGGSTLFVKMTGPAELLEVETEALNQLLESLRLTGADQPQQPDDSP